MSWKPGRGSGCGFDDAMRREEKYRSELNTLMSTPDATVKAISKVCGIKRPEELFWWESSGSVWGIAPL